MSNDQIESVTPASALYAFIGWITSRGEAVGPLSRNHPTDHIARLVAMYCEAQGWEEPTGKWYDAIRSVDDEGRVGV